MDKFDRVLFLLVGTPLRRGAWDLLILLVCVGIPWWVLGRLDPATWWSVSLMAGIYILGEIAIAAVKRRRRRRVAE